MGQTGGTTGCCGQKTQPQGNQLQGNLPQGTQPQLLEQGQGQQGGWGQQGQQGQKGMQGFSEMQGQGQGFNEGKQLEIREASDLLPNQNYKIVSALNPSYSLDANGHHQYKNQLIVYQFHGGQNQLWRFVPDNTGCYSIVNVLTGGTL